MAVLTITTTAGEAQRVATAFGARLGLGRDATNAEVKTAVIAYIRSIVRTYENEVAIAALVPAAFDPT
jgi:hypothetical protein